MLSISIQKQAANLYSSLLSIPEKSYKTRTLFVIDDQNPTNIMNDFSSIFLKENTPNWVPEQTLSDLPVTGRSFGFFKTN
jgi:hypothetical protein